MLELLGTDGEEHAGADGWQKLGRLRERIDQPGSGGRRFPVGPLIADVRDAQPATDSMSDPRDAHGEGVRGVEDEVGFALRQEGGQALLGEAARLDEDVASQRAKEALPRLLAGHGRPDCEAGRQERPRQGRALGSAAKQKDAFPHDCAPEKGVRGFDHKAATDSAARQPPRPPE